jgi:hypothetical protein
MISEIEIGEGGKTVEVLPSSTAPAKSRISEMMDNPDVPVAEISRAIAREISTVYDMMRETDPVIRRSQKELTEQVKVLQSLQRSLSDGEAQSRKDVLNFDGPKFAYVYKEIVSLFRKAMLDQNLDSGTVQNIMLQFSDLIKAAEEGIRRELSNMDKKS